MGKQSDDDELQRRRSGGAGGGGEYGGQLTPMDILRSQGDVGTPYKHHPALSQSTSSVQAFPLHKRGNAPKAQDLYPPVREASFFTRSNSQVLSFASLEDDARYWSSPKRGFTFYRHERRTTAAEIMRKGSTDIIALNTDTSYKAGVARRVADQTPYAQYGAMRSSVARLPRGGATEILTSTPHAVGPGSYEHGIPKSEPFLLQRRPSCIFQSTTPRLGKTRGAPGGEPVYASVSMDRSHWRPRFRGAGKFGTGQRSVVGKSGTPGPGAHDGVGTSRWPPPYSAKTKMQLGGFKADLPHRR